MKNNYPYLHDSAFLKQLIGLHVKQYFVKIAILNWQEKFVESIEGRVISANINIDGQSIIRRTATLSIMIDELINNITSTENLLSINKKVNLQIGFLNNTQKYKEYDFLWFPLGVYVITSNSISHSDSGLVASLQLKDKMCLLNGECGGTIPASTVFDTYQTIDENGEYIIERPTIYQIIRQLVNHFGGEQLGKIIISDLDVKVKQVMQWIGSSPLYYLKKGDQYLMTISPSEYTTQKNLGFKDVDGSPFESGRDVGYTLVDFAFPGDLIGEAGSTVTDILQQIKEVLGNYEYFYDINGNFVFQQIKNYLNNAQSKYILDSFLNRQFVPDYIDSKNDPGMQAYLIDTSSGTSCFEFSDSNLISSFSNTPQYLKIKNDYVVWGIRKTPDGTEIPIRYHLAIDKKPKTGNTYKAFEYEDPDDGVKKWHVPIQFAKKANFPTRGVVGLFYLDKSNNKIYKWEESNENFTYVQITATLENITTADWRTELYFQGVVSQPYGTESNYYYAELLNEWPKIYDIRNKKFRQEFIKDPVSLDYFLDFIDTQSAAAEFSVENIGRRSDVLNEGTNVNCVFESYIPDVVLINKDISGENNETLPRELRRECQRRNQPSYQVPSEIYDSLQAGGNYNSAYQVIRQMVHEYTSYNESISLQTNPIYFLEPNTRITVHDTKSNIHGDYMINSMSFSLDSSSFLTINATKALSKI